MATGMLRKSPTCGEKPEPFFAMEGVPKIEMTQAVPGRRENGHGSSVSTSVQEDGFQAMIRGYFRMSGLIGKAGASTLRRIICDTALGLRMYFEIICLKIFVSTKPTDALPITPKWRCLLQQNLISTKDQPKTCSVWS